MTFELIAGCCKHPGLKKYLQIVSVVVLLAGFGNPPVVNAEMCSLDVVPAATLLLPYFEVDLEDVAGTTTLFTIHNAEPSAALVHAIFWTDLAAPTIDFDIFLTGYDVVTMDMRHVFDGDLPVTADDQNDPNDLISPHGDPVWDSSFPNCSGIIPFTNPAIRATAFDRLRNGHTGNPLDSLSGNCLGTPHPSGTVARGYITFDNVSECSLVLDPLDAGYFVEGGMGIVNNKNQLWGDFVVMNMRYDAAFAQPLVHIEAEDGFSPDSGYTFYGRYTGGTDNREPLGGAWGARFTTDIPYFSQSEFLVWRDTTSTEVLPFGIECGSRPSWGQLEQSQVLCFDTEENMAELCSGQNCFSNATQRTGLYEVGVPYSTGWCFLNLNNACPTCFPGGFGSQGNLSQSYVSSIYTAEGLYEVGLPMVELSHACDDFDPLIVSIFRENFETGALDRWTISVP